MKKILSLISILAISSTLAVFASDIEIQPTMQSRTNAQDRIWVGAFQIVWNDFMDKIVHNPIRFREGTPTIVAELNKQEFTVDDINEASYYKYTGKVKKNTKKIISKAIRKKFKENSDLLSKVDLKARGDMYLIYAMLKKDFEFLNEFDKLERSVFGRDYVADYFGVDKHSDINLRRGIKVLFYNNSEDFAVVLQTKNAEEVYLYKNSSNKPFNYLWQDIEKKQLVYKGNKNFNKVDELRVPNITISEEKTFEELENRRIMGTNFVINQAMETIKFDMNNKGVKLKSEAVLSVETTSLKPEDFDPPRYFNFDNTFVLFLKEKDKVNPYFALRVNDITKFQK